SAGDSDYSQRAVAFIYGNVAVTREQLGEYLIARHGKEKVELLVNKMIIERACKQRGVEVTDAEVEAALMLDVKSVGPNVDAKLFEKHLLQRYGKSLLEWKEDVIKPRLLLTKLVRDQIKIEETELRQAFDSKFGKKIKCRMIMWPKGSGVERIALKEWT